ncbi:MAG: hypothetical protein MUP28_11985 [Candidatus Aminicenantes bacterium]|nr:hypothetical protein [Candidatus Aminicenantes bacterium]
MPEYSISQLGKFEECALQYKFIYVDGIKRELKAYINTEKRYTVTLKEES